MTAVHILIFAEMAGFRIDQVPFIASPVKMKIFFHGTMKKKKIFFFFFSSQLERANLHENN